MIFLSVEGTLLRPSELFRAHECSHYILEKQVIGIESKFMKFLDDLCNTVKR